MAIPDFQSIMLPLLTQIGDRETHSMRGVTAVLADKFELTQEEIETLLPSGSQRRFHNRVGWARTYLKKAGLLSSPEKAHIAITSRGVEVLELNLKKIDIKYLKNFPEFIEFKYGKKKKEPVIDTGDISSRTPEEEIDLAYDQVRNGLANDLLESVKSCSPLFFERLVVDLLLKMGYGGTRKDAGQAIGKAGDGGIDGIIKEDRLGLDIVYIQAKRWDSTVSRPEIQKFAGALQGQKAKKGIFITTDSFSKGAKEFTTIIDTKIILIDGDELAQLMIDFDIGVNTVTTYELKRIDSDYFCEE